MSTASFLKLWFSKMLQTPVLHVAAPWKKHQHVSGRKREHWQQQQQKFHNKNRKFFTYHPNLEITLSQRRPIKWKIQKCDSVNQSL